MEKVVPVSVEGIVPFRKTSMNNAGLNAELKANMGMVLRGDFIALKAVMLELSELLAKRPEVQIVHKHVSASKLWIKEGESPDG